MSSSSNGSFFIWARTNVPPILKGAKMAACSQIPLGVRRSAEKCQKKALQVAVMGGKVVDPFKPLQPGAYNRVDAVWTGLKAFAALAAKGTLPGSGGQVLQGGQLFPTPPFFGASFGGIKDSSIPFGGSTADEDKTLPGSGLTPEEKEFLINAAKSVNDFEAVERLKRLDYSPQLPKGFNVRVDDIQSRSDGSGKRVPSSRLARFAQFGQLAVGLGAGAAAEVARRTLRMGGGAGTTVDRVLGVDNPFMTTANANRIVGTLCRVRGAALKLGQMMSIQDSDLVPQSLLDIFEKVRNNADFMPTSQVKQQMVESFGPDWRDKLKEFDERPFAAASIGQVHKAILPDGTEVAIKIQYPGVADGIDSDIDNLVSVLSIGGLFPKGLHLENFVKVIRKELRLECDYLREARAAKKFRELLADSNDFYVPKVIDELTSRRVLTMELVGGRPVDKCTDEPQVVRDYIAAKFIELCLTEIFDWRFMQTDPNWSNFFFGKHPVTGEPRIILLDFGATRSYSKRFVDLYMRIIKAAYDRNNEEIIKYSREIGFLTGYESSQMDKAHCEATLILGETLASNEPFDFATQNVTRRIHKLIPVMLEHRLTSPPDEVYSLHRKLSGSYLLATKLRARVACGPIFTRIHDNYQFGHHDVPDITID